MAEENNNQQQKGMTKEEYMAGAKVEYLLQKIARLENELSSALAEISFNNKLNEQLKAEAEEKQKDNVTEMKSGRKEVGE